MKPEIILHFERTSGWRSERLEDKTQFTASAPFMPFNTLHVAFHISLKRNKYTAAFYTENLFHKESKTGDISECQRSPGSFEILELMSI